MIDTAAPDDQHVQTEFGVACLRRGQILTSERTIRDDFGLKPQQVRRLLGALEKAGMVERLPMANARQAATLFTVHVDPTAEGHPL